jgi:hypothetical protein
MPAYRAISAIMESTMPQRTKFVYTRLSASVTHQPVPANARSAARAAKHRLLLKRHSGSYSLMRIASLDIQL